MSSVLEKISDPVGLIGVFIILIAYLLLSIGRLSPDTIKFQFVNFLGAWLILFSLYYHWNLSSVVIELAWALISLLGMYRIFIRRK